MPLVAPSLNASDRPQSQVTASQHGVSARAYAWLMAMLVVLFVINIFVFASRPAEGGSYAVIVAPHLGQAALMETIATAGGTLVRQSRYSWLAIVSPARGTGQAGFARALRQAGAVLLLHPAMLAGCFTPDPHTENLAARPLQPSPFLSL